MRRATYFFCMLVIAIAGTAAANPIQLSFAVEPSQTLPGIPVTFRVTAMNTGSTPATLPSSVRLEMITETAASILFPSMRNESDLVEFPLLGDGSSIQLAPGEQRRLDFIAGPGTPPWFCDQRMQQPGTYRLRLRADRDFSGEDWVPSADPAISNEAVLTIATPAGVDAQAWALISGRNVCAGWDQFKSTLWSQYPDSVYTSMTVRPFPRRDDEAEMASLQATLAKNPPRGFGDTLKHAIATRHIMFMEDAITAGDVQKAFEHTEAARAILEELAAGDIEANLKAAVQQSLRVDVLTREELENYETRNRAIAPPRPPCESGQVALVRAEIAQAVADPATGSRTRAKLEMVLKHLDQYAAEIAKTPPAMSSALHELRAAVGEIDGGTRSLISAELGTRWLSGLVEAGAMAARKAVAAAAADAAVRAGTLAQSQQSLADADAAVTAGDFRTAIRLYKAALDKAESAAPARADYC